ncbi:MAG: NAD(P)H-dependent oxidoreductase [Bacteroidetes bacterium]|nr:NAD(P)H-dependent oxidoreductase [Bacteroidota bacterium]
MSKNILAFGASNSKSSINKALATYAANQISNDKVNLLDLNEFEMPIFSIDRERKSGIPALAHQFKKHIHNADGIIISFAEHNGSYTVAFKNIYDWISRIEKSVWGDKPLFLLGTSPGGRGAKTVLDTAVNKFERSNNNTVTSFSLPSFHKNFSEEEGIMDASLAELFDHQLRKFIEAL